MPIELANAHTSPWVFIGAGGVTGKLILERALAAGHRPVLVGRNATRLAALADRYDLEARVAALDDAKVLAAAVRGAPLILNVAGPFSLTARPIIASAMAEGCDYVDVNGELQPLQMLLAQGEAASRAGVALVGGAGFGVAAADCLARQVFDALGGADRLRIAVAADSAFSSTGVAESTLAVIAGGGREVVGGNVVKRRLAAHRWRETRPDGTVTDFASAPLAELAAVSHALPVPSIVAGVPMARRDAVTAAMLAPLLPILLKIPAVRRQMAGTGGHAAKTMTRTGHVSRVWVSGTRGKETRSAMIEMGEGFAEAADIALRAVERMLAQRLAPGVYTPSTAFGANFIDARPGLLPMGSSVH